MQQRATGRGPYTNVRVGAIVRAGSVNARESSAVAIGTNNNTTTITTESAMNITTELQKFGKSLQDISLQVGVIRITVSPEQLEGHD